MRDLDIGANNKRIAVSFDGNIIEDIGTKWRVRQITKNRLRNILYLGDGNWVATGDNNNEEGNYFESKDNGKTWIKSKNKYSDIHRIIKHKGIIWMVGKNGLIMKKKI